MMVGREAVVGVLCLFWGEKHLIPSQIQSVFEYSLFTFCKLIVSCGHFFSLAPNNIC